MSRYETDGAMMKKIEGEKKVIIYCRESRDDGAANYERIETQRDILVGYCKDKNLGHITQIIMDDNKSGTSFLFIYISTVKQQLRLF